MEIMNSFYIAGIPKVTFGAGLFADLHKIIRAYGRNVLVITGNESFRKSGRFDALKSDLEKSKCKVFDESIKGEPSPIMIDRIVRDFRKQTVNVVVSIGGGSAIDCGKAVSAMLAEDGSVKDYLEGVGTRKPSGDKAPFIAVPTTAGTGCEATANAVISDTDEGFKKSLRHRNFVPDEAVVDPELTIGAPSALTAACGFDAVSQLIESYTSTKSNVFTDSLAIKALALASRNLLPASTDRGGDITVRSAMSYAALVSGITLMQAGLGTVHGIAGPLGGIVPAPHGTVCGKLLLPVMTLSIKKIIDEKNTTALAKFADIGRAFSDDQGKDDNFYVEQLLGVIRSWTESLKLPTLSAFGMKQSDIEKIVSLSDNKNSPAQLTGDEIRQILETVL
jgi:alcohol dehydrogenase class IV